MKKLEVPCWSRNFTIYVWREGTKVCWDMPAGDVMAREGQWELDMRTEETAKGYIRCLERNLDDLRNHGNVQRSSKKLD